jgi:glutamate-1-semialdehyde 2,1-aminomutase
MASSSSEAKSIIKLSDEQSRSWQKRAEAVLPGGVDSPVRAFQAVGGEPPFIVCAEGAYLWDADGNRYLDYCGSWGPMILGHAFPPVVRAIQEAATQGSSFGATTPAEVELAERVRQCFPSIEMLRFVSSGTEAAMSAIRLARGFTGRSIIVKFEGCYHGHSDALLVKGGSGIATMGIPGSAGVPPETVQHTLALPYNDIAAVEEAFARYRGQIACVIVEPVAGNAGCIPPAEGFLQALRRITEREGALLILDEVITGFRVALGGAQELYGIRPDLTCLGKILGGGLPCGAFGGRGDIMKMLAPLGPVYQAGTLSGNPLAMAAGLATVGCLMERREAIYAQLEAASESLVRGVMRAAEESGVPVTANRVGSMWPWFFSPKPVKDYTSACRADLSRFASFHRAMLDAGIWLPPSQFECAFLSLAHKDEEIAATLATAERVFGWMSQG